MEKERKACGKYFTMENPKKNIIIMFILISVLAYGKNKINKYSPKLISNSEYYSYNESKIESCISNLMLDSGYFLENEFFLKKETNDIILFKNLKDRGYDLKLKRVSSNKVKISQESKYPDFEIQIWSFESEKKAASTCDLIKKITSESSFFEKPPKVISYYNNYCVFLTTPSYSNTFKIEKAIDIIDTGINNCIY